MQEVFAEAEGQWGDEPPFPKRVRTAGITWIVMGTLILIGMAVMCLVISARPAAKVDPNAGAKGILELPEFYLLLGLLIGGLFLNAGIRTVRGHAADTLVNGIGSIGFGLLNFCAGGAATFVCAIAFADGPGAAGGKREDYLVFAIIGAIPFVCGLGLVTVGALSLASRGQYLQWRRWHKCRAGGDRV